MGQKLSVVYYFENRFKKIQPYNEYTILAIVIWTLMSDMSLPFFVFFFFFQPILNGNLYFFFLPIISKLLYREKKTFSADIISKTRSTKVVSRSKL